MKWLLKKMFASVGLEGPARKTLHTLRAAGWTPWKPLVPEEAFCTCVRNAVEKLQELERPHELGDYLEFGVSRGTSMACAYRTLQKSGLHEMRLIGFDSFEGLPPEAAREGWGPGEYRSSLSATRNYLKRHNVDLARVKLVKGWFRDTLTERSTPSLA